MKTRMYMVFAIFFALLVSCDSGGDSGDTDGSVVLDDSVSGQSPDANPPAGNPAPTDTLDDFQAFMLDVVNEARGQSRNCGAEFFPEAPPVTWDERIEAAAQMHAEDMAANENVSHTGSDGSEPGDRLLTEGYDWFTWGENVLFGINNGADALDTLLDSPPHCGSIMNPDFQEVGAGSAQGSFQGFTSTYWTILFATESN